MNRYYRWKLPFLHVNASNLRKITIALELGGNISLPNKIPLALPFEGFPPMIKQVTNSFCSLLPLCLKGRKLLCYQFEWVNEWVSEWVEQQEDKRLDNRGNVHWPLPSNKMVRASHFCVASYRQSINQINISFWNLLRMPVCSFIRVWFIHVSRVIKIKRAVYSAESANSHNSHKLLHLTSWNPRIHHKRFSLFLFLAHPCPFSSFHHAITCHTITCFVHKCIYARRTSSQLFSLPVIFVLEEVGGRVRCFCLGSCINPFWEVRGPGHFSPKNSKIPQPTSQ